VARCLLRPDRLSVCVVYERLQRISSPSIDTFPRSRRRSSCSPSRSKPRTGSYVALLVLTGAHA
jgi:hypothetical protein